MINQIIFQIINQCNLILIVLIIKLNFISSESMNTLIKEDKKKDESERPLLFKWKIWYFYHKKNQNSNQKDNFSNILTEVVVFDTVENFWRYYLNPY